MKKQKYNCSINSINSNNKKGINEYSMDFISRQFSQSSLFIILKIIIMIIDGDFRVNSIKEKYSNFIKMDFY